MGAHSGRRGHHRHHRSLTGDTFGLAAHIEQGKSLGSVESVKAVSDIYSPVSGEVTEVNETLAQAPEKLNQDPHGAAWLIKLRLSAPNEAKGLLSAADYQAYVGAES